MSYDEPAIFWIMDPSFDISIICCQNIQVISIIILKCNYIPLKKH